ncbi:MAG: phosphoribosylaminoimidazolesuccinocarboxamide synthase [Nitrososphaeraceae archaeon]
MRLLREGKVKNIFELESGNLLMVFSDRVSAFDIKFDQRIPNKGKVLCRFADYWFNKLNVPNHFIGMRQNNAMEVRKLSMIPYEFIVRGYYYGSMLERYASDTDFKSLFGSNLSLMKGAKLPRPIFEITTKSEEHDVPVEREKIIDSGILGRGTLKRIEDRSFTIYDTMFSIAKQSGFIIADVKLEFGFDEQSDLTLADSLGPDESRIWLEKDYQPGQTQGSYDKQLLRDWLIEIGFKKEMSRLALKGEIPKAPKIPDSIISQMSDRYIYVYEKITGGKIW